MSPLRALGFNAKYNILTPAVLLGVGMALYAGGPALAADHTNPANTTITNFDIPAGDSLTNNGTIYNPSGEAVTSDGDVTFLVNSATGQISSDDEDAVEIDGNLGSLTNAGRISGYYEGVYVSGDVGTFANSNYISGYDSPGVDIEGDVTGSFTNSGEIYGIDDDDAVYIDGAVASFTNTKTGVIGSTYGDGVDFEGLVSSFTNDGTIKSGDDNGVYFGNGVTDFSNGSTGHIISYTDSDAVYIEGESGPGVPAVATFNNAGEIKSAGWYGVAIENDSEGDESDVWVAAGSITNSGTVSGVNDAFYIEGDVGSFANLASGIIQSVGSGYYDDDDGTGGVVIYGSVTGTFSNAGSIVNTGFSGKGSDGPTYGVLIAGDVATFENTGKIVSTGNPVFDGEFYAYPAIGVAIGGTTGKFTNSGQISGSGVGVLFGDPDDFYEGDEGGDSSESFVTSFTNTSSGVIEGDGLAGVAFEGGVGDFNNAGKIIGPVVDPSGDEGSAGVVIGGDVGSFVNSGSISGYGVGVAIEGEFGTFNNSGTITSSGGTGVYVNGESDLSTPPVVFGTFTNSGTISGLGYGLAIDNETAVTIINSGTIESNDLVPFEYPDGSIDYYGAASGLRFNGGTLINSGTIRGDIGANIFNDALDTTVINSGSIIGTHGPGIVFEGSPDPTVVNSGLISGSNGIAVDFGNTSGDNLVLQTGGKFIGAVNYGPGTNTFDFSDYHGNSLIDFTGGTLDPANITGGNNLYVQKGSQVAIYDDTAIQNAAQPIEDLVGGVQGSVSDALNGANMGGGGGDNFVANYAAARPSTPAASAAQSVGIRPDGSRFDWWGNVFGGGDTNSNGSGSSTAFGGFAVGAQSEWAPGVTLGLVGSYGHTNFSIDNGPQTITGDTGMVGVYGKTMLDPVTLDFSVLAGFGNNKSTRTISTGAGEEVATASFGSWFIAPQVGASIPVLHVQNGQFNIAGKLGYIGGNFGGYSETGSAADAVVGAETIGIFDARVELNGKTVLSNTGMGDAVLSGKIGLFAQSNVGNSTTPVALLGEDTVGSTIRGASGVGVYAGAGVDMPVSDNLTIGASATGSARNDGTYGGIGKLRIGGSF